MQFRCVGAFVISLFMVLVGFCRADISPEVVEKGKKATALIELGGGKGFGSAFCIDTAGVFVTNDHVVAALPEGGTLSLVLRAGESDQKAFPAKVLWRDKDADLALLQIEKTDSLTPLELGDAHELIETTPVVAFGYPFGTDLALGKNQYPGVTVSTGHITALRKAQGLLQMIQLDASLNPGNSGGPILNSKGQVIGIVMAGIRGSGINFAIPVNQLQPLIYRTRIQFTPPFIPTEAQRFERDFLIQLATPDKAPEKTVELSLSADAEDHRIFTARSTDGRNFVVHAPAVPVSDGGTTLLLTVRGSGSGEMVYRVKDQDVRIGLGTFRLSKIKKIEGSERATVTMTDGKTSIGKLTGLEAVPTYAVSAAEAVMRDLNTASSITVAPFVRSAKTVQYRITVRQGAKIVGELAGTIEIGVPALPAASGDAVQTPSLANDALWQPVQLVDLGAAPAIAWSSPNLVVALPVDARTFKIGMQSLKALQGDFDIQVSYRLLEWPSLNGARLGFDLFNLAGARIGTLHRVCLNSSDFQGEARDTETMAFADGGGHVRRATTATSGKLRIVRRGDELGGFVWDASKGGWVAIGSGAANREPVLVNLLVWSEDGAYGHKSVKVAFSDFVLNNGRWVEPR